MRLRTLFTIGAVGGLSALGLAANLPAHAAGPGTGNCVAADGAPTPGAGATAQPLPDGGTLYQWGTTSGGIQANGPHGWIDARGDATGPNGSISGYSSDAPVNGSVGGSATSPSLCISVGGQKVTAP
jgi:hypothetical protein